MTKEAWIKRYDETKERFRWFIDEYFPKMMEILEEYKLANQAEIMQSALNDIWFYLPDNKFNIIQNPKGWSEFLNLLEEEID